MRASISFVSLSRRAVVLMLLLFMAAVTYAQITPSDDSYINSAASATNYGTAVTLDLSSPADTAFIRFDLTAVPAGYTGASIAKATLKLYVNACTKAGSFNVDLVNGAWTEKTIDYSNEPALGTTIAPSVPLATTNKGTYVEIDITPALVEWLNGTQPNDGIALVANSPLVATFDSKENTATSHPPELDIVYASGGTITGITTASGSGLQGGGTSGTLNLSLTNACATNQVLQWNGTAWVCANLGGGGTVTSVGFTAPSTDFIVTGSPVTTSGTLGLGWLVAPDFNNTPNAIIKRDSNGNFSAGAINAQTSFNLAGNVFDSGSFANYNAFLGFAGSPNIPPTGIANTAGGYQALFSDTAGQGNTAYGTQALYSNTTGSGNIALGGHTLFMNTIGASNTAVGGYALKLATNASQNTATGNSALFSTTTGSNNTASGYQALYYNTTGSYNTALGYEAAYDQTYTTLTNATAIGANSDVTESNALVLGSINGVNGATANTSVGIGTTAPQYALDVHGTGNFTGLVNFASGQTFPGAGTITGVTAGTDLTGGGTGGNVTLNVDTTKVVTGVVAGTDLTGGGTGGVLTLNLDTTKVPQLAATNTFMGKQYINNNVAISATNSTALTVIGGYTGVSGAGTGYGLYGTATNATSYGVYGSGSYGVYGDGSGTTSYGVYGYSSNIGMFGSGGYYAVFADGNLGYTGSLTGAVALPDERVVSLYAMQSPENWFEDFGSGQLKDGVATIKLEATFAHTVNTSTAYHVFLTPNGDSKGLYVSQKTATSFEVREQGGGTSNVAFDYRIVAKRRGLESLRLEDQHADHETAEAIRQFIATRPSNTPRLQHPPKPPEHAAVPEPPKLEPPKLLQQPPVPAQPRTSRPVPQQHVAVPEPPK